MSISVLMSVYKKENPMYLKEALESMIHQTLACEEIVLMADGPLTDELYSVIDQVKDQYAGLKLYQIPENVMLGEALRQGLEHCSCEFIARMDSDDVALLSRLEAEYTFLKNHPEIAVVGGFIEEFSEDSDETRIKSMPQGGQALKKYARFRNPLNHMTVMFRKSAVLAAGSYRHFPYLEDYDLWCRMQVCQYKFYNLQAVMVKARTGKAMVARRGGIAYFKQYRQLRRYQYHHKLLKGWEYILSLGYTAVMTLQPGRLRQVAYQILRRRK